MAKGAAEVESTEMCNGGPKEDERRVRVLEMVYRQNAPAKWCASFRLLLTPWVVARVGAERTAGRGWGRSQLQEEGCLGHVAPRSV